MSWREIAEHSDIVLSFGGLALKNSQVASGGMSTPNVGICAGAAERGAQFISISPLRHDLPDEAAGEWIPVRPGTDAALMLALLHTLWRHGLSDEDFLARYCTGWPTLVAFLNGTQDGTVRDAAAEAICGVPAAHCCAGAAPAR